MRATRSTNPARPAPVVVLAALALVATLVPGGGAQTPNPSSPGATLRITELLADPDASLAQREFVEVWNPTNQTVNLAGWRLHDAATTSGSTNTYTFASWTLRPNARVVVWGGGAADAKGPAWSNAAVWNNAGDGAFLVDPANALVDYVGYGTTVPPEGWESHVTAKPAKGQSTQLDGAAWIVGSPNPGTVAGAIAGDLTLDVANVPPSATWTSVPAAARPGRPVTLSFALNDANGAADVAAWTLSSQGVQQAAGTGAGGQSATLTAPTGSTSWTLTLQATDLAGATATATAVIPLQDSDLVVTVTHPTTTAARPGDATTPTQATITVGNAAATTVTPLVDISDFHGPQGDLAAQGHVTLVRGSQRIEYQGALTRLEPLATGASADWDIELHDLPVPLAAGAYAATFSLVAA